jgi:dipeptidase E
MNTEASRREFLLAAGTAFSTFSLGAAAATSGAGSATAKPAKRQIFAMDSGFLSEEPWVEPVIARHLFSLTGKAEPRICLLATASGDSSAIIETFYRIMGRYPCRASHLNMFAPSTSDFARFFSGHDIVYVAGGATRNLMSVWKDWKLDEALRTAWDAGVILSGESAGLNCWFESCITDSLPEKLLPLSCLGFLKGSACPHYDPQLDRPALFNRPLLFRSLIASGEIPGPGIAVQSHVALHYVEDQLVDVVTDKKGSRAFKVERVPNGYLETPIDARYIGT